MRIRALACLGLALSVFSAGAPLVAADYPANFTVDGQVKSGDTSVKTTFAIRVEHLMEERHRVRVTDALRYGGYPKFYEALKALPVVGTVAFADRKVQIRYAREQAAGDKRHVTLASDTPLFFLGGNEERTRAGFNLTVVDFTIDAKGVITGMMSGAARVRPSPPDSFVLDDFAVEPVLLTGHVGKP